MLPILIPQIMHLIINSALDSLTVALARQECQYVNLLEIEHVVLHVGDACQGFLGVGGGQAVPHDVEGY